MEPVKRYSKTLEGQIANMILKRLKLLIKREEPWKIKWQLMMEDIMHALGRYRKELNHIN